MDENGLYYSFGYRGKEQNKQRTMNEEQFFGVILLLSGPSGVGKSTVAHALLKEMPNIHFSVSCTTRTRRPDEIEGESYYFITEEKYDELLAQNVFLENAEVHGRRYGTLKSELKGVKDGQNILLDIDFQGMRQARRNLSTDPFYGARLVTVFLLPPTMEELERRLRGRKTEGEEAIQRRLRNARDEIETWREYDYVLINEDSEESAKDLAAILRASHFRTMLLTENPVK